MRKPPAFFRWIVLLLISIGMFGNYYIYDCISPLADMLKSQLNFSDSNIGTLQAIYSLPNIIMVLIGGVIIDRIGTKKSALIFSFLVLLGAGVTLLRGDIVMMAAGRLIFGLGAESMIVAITTVIARWFKGKELSFAFGLNLTIARLGSFLALNSPSWAKSLYTDWQGPLWISVFAGIIAVISLLIYYFVDYYSERNYDMPKEGSQDKIIFKDLINFGNSFWFITLLCFTFYSAIFPFQTFAIKFFNEVHGATREAGGFLSSMLTFAAMIFTPLFGLLADRIGKRALLMMFGSLLIMPVYLMMGYKFDIAGMLNLVQYVNIQIGILDINATVPLNLLIPMGMMGMAFSLIPAVMWPSVALVVDNNKLGTAYGLMTMIQNIGLTLFNILIGKANDLSNAGIDNPEGYRLGMWIFSILGILGLFFAIMLKLSERNKKVIGGL